MDFTKYVNNLKYPRPHDFSTTYWYRAGQVVCTQKPGESLASGFDTSKCVKEVCCDEEGLKAARAAYNAETQRIHAQFKQDLFADLGIENHPLRNKLFSKAWDDGHANGFAEVYNCALNLVDLIEVPENTVLVTANGVAFGPGTRNPATIEAAEKLARELRD